MAKQPQSVCHDTLPWLISFSLGRMMHMRLLRAFLWLSVLAWGIGAGAKFYDLIVVAGAWSASPPESLSLMPYGAHYPVMPGQFYRTDIGCHADRCHWRADLRLAHTGFISRLAFVVRHSDSRALGIHHHRLLAEQSCAFRGCAAFHS
jgi:hypothetical protein